MRSVVASVSGGGSSPKRLTCAESSSGVDTCTGSGSMLSSSMPRRFALCSTLPLLSALACGSPTSDAGDGGTETSSASATTDMQTGSESDGETGEDELLSATITHRFGTYALDPFEEEPDACVAWTLDNDASLYVQSVMLSNLGYWHHSNWFVVPEDTYPGPDGYFNCADRGFTEFGAAAAGTVLFAQSTQSFVEEQRTGDGAVIKIPPRHTVVSTVHLLNIGPAPVETDLFMTLELIHPKQVTAVLAPFQMTYFDLDLPAHTESRFTGNCSSIADEYEAVTGGPMDIKLHYALPHYHYLGNFFDLRVNGGSMDGQSVFEHQGFDGEGLGGAFDPPIDLSDANGLSFTCGFDNWLDIDIGWGNGDGEMCVMLGLAESKVLMDLSVDSGTIATGQTPDGIYEFEAPCSTFTVLKNPAQTPPTLEEIAAPLYVPPSKPEDQDVPPIPVCVDHDPTVMPDIEPTLSNVFGVVFNQSCAFNSCHGGGASYGGLDLHATDLLGELLGHVTMANPGMALVEPGDPDNSWLYQIISECAPVGANGVVGHMPRNAPILLDDRSIALVREWIAAGAANN